MEGRTPIFSSSRILKRPRNGGSHTSHLQLRSQPSPRQATRASPRQEVPALPSPSPVNTRRPRPTPVPQFHRTGTRPVPSARCLPPQPRQGRPANLPRVWDLLSCCSFASFPCHSSDAARSSQHSFFGAELPPAEGKGELPGPSAGSCQTQAHPDAPRPSSSFFWSLTKPPACPTRLWGCQGKGMLFPGPLQRGQGLRKDPHP